MTRLPTLFIPHGGGPCFFMEWTRSPADTWQRMADWLSSLVASLGVSPKALLVVSGHWEEPGFAATGAAHPSLIYDYYGFPEHTYRLRWDAPGAPALATEVVERLGAAGLPARVDPTRGLDHGVFVPLKLVYPAADMPTVQLSLDRRLDPAYHIATGHALAGLRDEGVLIIGSGMSYHNMRGYGDPASTPIADRFDAWLTDSVEAEPAVREARLTAWTHAPNARDAHPREEHLLPLMVAAGAGAADPGRRIFSDRVMETRVSGYRFG